VPGAALQRRAGVEAGDVLRREDEHDADGEAGEAADLEAHVLRPVGRESLVGQHAAENDRQRTGDEQADPAAPHLHLHYGSGRLP